MGLCFWPYKSNVRNLCLNVRFLLPMSVFAYSRLSSDNSENAPLMCIEQFERILSSPSNKFRRNISRYSVVACTPFFKSLQFARTREFLKNHAFSAKISFDASKPKDLKYLIKKHLSCSSISRLLKKYFQMLSITGHIRFRNLLP